jgi:hypothetical protein
VLPISGLTAGVGPLTLGSPQHADPYRDRKRSVHFIHVYRGSHTARLD